MKCWIRAERSVQRPLPGSGLRSQRRNVCRYVELHDVPAPLLDRMEVIASPVIPKMKN
ncbi:hypothetical protein ACLK2I_02410 [Escherichia coli]